jgi:hypothetical protein
VSCLGFRKDCESRNSGLSKYCKKLKCFVAEPTRPKTVGFGDSQHVSIMVWDCWSSQLQFKIPLPDLPKEKYNNQFYNISKSSFLLIKKI